MQNSIAAAIFLTSVWSASAALAATPAQKCEAGMNLAAGLYFKCLSTAQKVFISTGDMAKYDAAVGKCEAKLEAKWEKLEAVGAGNCPSEGGLAAIKALLDGCNAGVADGASGETPPPDPRVCAAELETCNSDLAICNSDLAACSSAAPVPGDLVITEVMHTPSASYPNGEWFEVQNRTSTVLDLSGLRVDETSSGANFTLPSSPFLVQPGASFVFSRSASAAENGFGASGYQWASFALPSSLMLVLSLDGTEITRTVIDGTFPNTTGRAVQLSSDISPGSSRSWHWCNALSLLGNGDYGTPETANHDCGINVSPPIDYCTVQFPKDVTVAAGSPTTVGGRFYEPDVTTRSTTGNDFYPLLEMEFGYGPAGTNATSFTWSTSTFNNGYTAVSSNDDEIQRTVSFPTPGSYSYGFRMRLVDPVTGTPGAYTYCGRDNTVLPSATTGWSTATVN